MLFIRWSLEEVIGCEDAENVARQSNQLWCFASAERVRQLVPHFFNSLSDDVVVLERSQDGEKLLEIEVRVGGALGLDLLFSVCDALSHELDFVLLKRYYSLVKVSHFLSLCNLLLAIFGDHSVIELVATFDVSKTERSLLVQVVEVEPLEELD